LRWIRADREIAEVRAAELRAGIAKQVVGAGERRAGVPIKLMTWLPPTAELLLPPPVVAKIALAGFAVPLAVLLRVTVEEAPLCNVRPPLSVSVATPVGEPPARMPPLLTVMGPASVPSPPPALGPASVAPLPIVTAAVPAAELLPLVMRSVPPSH